MENNFKTELERILDDTVPQVGFDFTTLTGSVTREFLDDDQFLDSLINSPPSGTFSKFPEYRELSAEETARKLEELENELGKVFIDEPLTLDEVEALCRTVKGYEIPPLNPSCSETTNLEPISANLSLSPPRQRDLHTPEIPATPPLGDSFPLEYPDFVSEEVKSSEHRQSCLPTDSTESVAGSELPPLESLELVDLSTEYPPTAPQCPLDIAEDSVEFLQKESCPACVADYLHIVPPGLLSSDSEESAEPPRFLPSQGEFVADYLHSISPGSSLSDPEESADPPVVISHSPVRVEKQSFPGYSFPFLYKITPEVFGSTSDNIPVYGRPVFPEPQISVETNSSNEISPAPYLDLENLPSKQLVQNWYSRRRKFRNKIKNKSRRLGRPTFRASL